MMFDFLFETNYESRKLGRQDPTPDRFGVSTAYTSDEGYETAILAEDVHPVERYPNRDAAVIGHEKWIKWTIDNPRDGAERKITMLGCMHGLVGDEEVTIQ